MHYALPAGNQLDSETLMDKEKIMSTTDQPVTVVHVQPGLGLPPKPDKSLALAYVLWGFFGFIGGHQFYLGKNGRGVAYLFTFAFLTIAVWIDLFTLPSQLRDVNNRRRLGL